MCVVRWRQTFSGSHVRSRVLARHVKQKYMSTCLPCVLQTELQDCMPSKGTHHWPSIHFFELKDIYYSRLPRVITHPSIWLVNAVKSSNASPQSMSHVSQWQEGEYSRKNMMIIKAAAAVSSHTLNLVRLNQRGWSAMSVDHEIVSAPGQQLQ